MAMKTTLEKFRWWQSQIAREEERLLYSLHKIFRSYRLQFQLLERYSIDGEGFPEIATRVDRFSVTNSFEENARLFNIVYRRSVEYGLFDLDVPYLDLVERMRKTQYHIWRLFRRSREYNILVRQYNDRIHRPSRAEIARSHGFRERPFIVKKPWYHGPSSVTMIGVCGPSCSGKSTVCRSLVPYFDAQMVQLDRFFRKEAAGRCNGYPNWETLDSLMVDRFIECLRQLKRGEPTLVPSRGWTEVFDRIVYPKPIIFVDGFLLFLNRDLNTLLDRKIFIEVREDSILHRRVQRNGHDAWAYTAKCVVPNYVKVRPALIREADVVIDGDDELAIVRSQVKSIVERTVETPDMGPLEAIEEAFAREYRSYDLRIPRENVRRRRNGRLRCGSGMLFYAFGKENGREYLEYYRYHHMGEGHDRIFDDGTVVHLATLDDIDVAFGFSGTPEEEEAEMEREYRETVESIYSHGLYDEEWHPSGGSIREES